MAAASLSEEQFYDPRWRLNNLYTIMDERGKAVPFRPRWAQQEIIEGLHTRNLSLKARQVGVTTVICLIQLDDCLFNPNIRAAVIAHKLDDAKRIFRDKVKFPYDNLDPALRQALGSTQDSADTLTLANNSSFQVSTSARSGTLNWLHISEYGKICAQFPEKAREIRTGSFPAAEAGTITIESTAEGEGGDFYEKCQQAKAMVGKELERTDFKFFFFPWFKEQTYRQAKATTPTGPEDERYFTRIEVEAGTELDQAQRNWWLAMERQLGGDMKREYPATSREAFEAAIEGAIYADDLAIAQKQERIGTFPIDRTRPVNTFWDLGWSVGNETAIWLEQDHGQRPTFVGYYENSGEFIDHYFNWLVAWATEHGTIWGKHYMPFDADRNSLWLKDGTMNVMARLGWRPIIVEREPNKIEGIRIGRRKMAMAAFDEGGCKTGLQRLRSYRKEWDEKRGVWREHPHHGPESNGADAFLTFAESNHIAMPALKTLKDKYREDAPDPQGSWMSA